MRKIEWREKMDIKNIANKKLEEWINTLLSKDPEKMIALYHEDAVLLPTIDATVRQGSAKIKAYFETFLAKGPVCELQETIVIPLSENAVSIVGHYGFSFADGSTADARLTYIFTEEKGEWKIKHHHSSLQPK